MREKNPGSGGLGKPADSSVESAGAVRARRRRAVIEIELWKPCLDCPSAAIATRTDKIVCRGCSTEATVVCSWHAEVCRRINGAEPLIGGEK